MLWSRYLSCNSGNIGIATAVMAVPLVMGVALATETTNLVRVNSNVQQALDAAAMAIAVKVPSSMSDTELETLGRDHMYAHLDTDYFAAGVLPAFRYLGLTTDSDGVQHILVETDYKYDLFFGDVISKTHDRSSGIAYSTRSRVSVRMGDPACVYALSRTAPRAVEAGGSTNVTMDGCVVHSNSAADDAIYVGGSANIEADCVQASGGIDTNGGLVTDCGAGRESVWPLPDPFASLLEPVPPILYPNPKKKHTTVKAGRYRNLSLDGTKTLKPGLYYIEGDLSIKGDISGTGVVFFMKDGAITVNGTASLSLDAPTTGPYAGMLFWSAQNNYSAHKFNGTGATDLNGYLYFPKGDLTYNGNNGTTSTCLRLVADTITMTGDSQIKSDCTAELGGREALVSGPLHFSL